MDTTIKPLMKIQVIVTPQEPYNDNPFVPQRNYYYLWTINVFDYNHFNNRWYTVYTNNIVVATPRSYDLRIIDGLPYLWQPFEEEILWFGPLFKSDLRGLLDRQPNLEFVWGNVRQVYKTQYPVTNNS